MPKRKGPKEEDSDDSRMQIKVIGLIKTPSPSSQSSNGGKVANFKQFEFNGTTYSLGSCVYLENLENADKPDMMKVVRICTVEHKKAMSVEVTGRWLYGPHFQQNKLLIQDKFAMDDHEVLFSVEESEMDVDLIIGSFKVISKEDFERSSAELKLAKKPKILKRQDILKRGVYYCSRAWIPRAKALVDSFKWSHYEENSKEFVQSRPKRSSAASLVGPSAGSIANSLLGELNSTTPRRGTRASTKSTPGTGASQRVKALAVGGSLSATKTSHPSKRQTPSKSVQSASTRSAGRVHKKSTPRKQVLTPVVRRKREDVRESDDDELITHEEVVTLKSGRSSRKRENAYKDDHDDQSDDESFENSDIGKEESDDDEDSMDESQDSQQSDVENDIDDNDEAKIVSQVRKRTRIPKQRKRTVMKSTKRYAAIADEHIYLI